MRTSPLIRRLVRLAVAAAVATGFTLAGSVSPSAAEGTCYYVYVQTTPPAGTTVCP